MRAVNGGPVSFLSASRPLKVRSLEIGSITTARLLFYMYNGNKAVLLLSEFGPGIGVGALGQWTSSVFHTLTCSATVVSGSLGGSRAYGSSKVPVGQYAHTVTYSVNRAKRQT